MQRADSAEKSAVAARSDHDERTARPLVVPATLIGLVLLPAANGGFFIGPAPSFENLQALLQFDGAAIRQGELWRLVTFNLVHLDARHFLLNALAFVGLGLLYEREFGRWYAPLLLASGLAVGLGMFLLLPEGAIARGLSGVVACQLAVALIVEARRAAHTPRRWLIPLIVAALFVFWLYYKWRVFLGG